MNFQKASINSIKLVKAGAQEGHKKYSILENFTIAQASDESGWVST